MCNPPARPLRAEDWAYERRGEAGDGAGQESAAVHSMTWSARPKSDGGIVRPSALAVLRLIISSNFIGCSTERLAGFALDRAPRREPCINGLMRQRLECFRRRRREPRIVGFALGTATRNHGANDAAYAASVTMSSTVSFSIADGAFSTVTATSARWRRTSSGRSDCCWSA